ncbi:MAG: Type-2 restriction enzyme BamHI [Firmicutes bacterium ADurb.Bin099]|nr:MAG: Type-2 restriction enzyme BamHI [Firmicutes bacterium ADurb.Bin099]
MITKLYNYRSGESVVPKDQLQGVCNILSSVNPHVRKNTVSEIREVILSGLAIQGWSGAFRIDVASKITISSYKDGIGLCLQTGNISRIYADLLKLQSLYLKGKIKAGIIILPQKVLAIKLASNMVSYERLVGELSIFNQVISMPLVIIGFNAEELL